MPKRLQFDFRHFPDEIVENLRHMAYLRGETLTATARDILIKAAVHHRMGEPQAFNVEFPPAAEPEPVGIKPPWER